MDALVETFRKLHFNIINGYGDLENNPTAAYADIEIDIINNQSHISLYGKPGDYSLGLDEAAALTPERLDCIVAIIDDKYMEKVYLRKKEALNDELKRTRLVHDDLRKEYNLLEGKYEKLKEKLYYAPGGDGAATAQSHFESLMEQ